MSKSKTYGVWLNEWFNVYKKPYIRSYKNIKSILRLHIPEYVKKTPLDRLDAFDVQKALNAVKQSRTRLDVYNVYHGSLIMAYRLGYTPRNLADLLVKPKHQRELGKALTNDELKVFISRIESDRLKNFYMFCLLTGCRRSEALFVKWNDIDEDNQRIHIRGTKTAMSDRYIPILPDCAALLKSIPRNGEAVFHHTAKNVTTTFKKLCPEHKLHDLRHTFATRCLECGINIKVVQKWLGHSRLDTTASIYVHCREDFQKSEASKFKLTK